MNIYFTSSNKIAKEYQLEYDKIVKELKTISNNVYLYIPTNDNEKVNELESKKRILMSDIIVADVSYSSKHLGYELGFAVNQAIPIELISTNINTTNMIISERFAEIEPLYYKKNNLDMKIKEIIKRIKLNTSHQFTINLPAKLNEYLIWISETKGIQRSVFIEGLIENALKKDSKFKKSILTKD